MARLAVTVVLLFLACAHAFPAPLPANPKFTFAKDSDLRLGVAGGKSKAGGVVKNNASIDTPPVEAPLPGNTGDNVPDVTVLDNVNAGAAFAYGGSISSGVVKNNKFSDNKVPFSDNK